MDIRVNRTDLLRELGLARRLAERKATIPVYGYALLTPASDALNLYATDGESRFVTSCPVTMEQGGQALVPVRMLHEMLRQSVADEVRLTQDGQRVKVAVGSFRSTLQTLEISDFPSMPETPKLEAMIGTAFLRAAIDRVRFVIEAGAVSPNQSYQHGALLDVTETVVALVSTDGRRVAVAETAHPGAAAAQALLPRKAVDDLAALLADADETEVTYAVDEVRAYFGIGRRLFATQLLAEKFPNYRRVVPPQKGEPEATVPRDLWLGAMRRVMLVSTEAARRATLALSRDAVTVSMRAADIGDATEPVPATVRGTAWEAGFDSACLTEFLEAAGTGDVRMEQATPTSPAAFRSDADGVRYTYVLMPMSV